MFKTTIEVITDIWLEVSILKVETLRFFKVYPNSDTLLYLRKFMLKQFNFDARFLPCTAVF